MKHNFTVKIDQEADIIKRIKIHMWQNVSLKYFFATSAYFNCTRIKLVEKFILIIVVCYKIIYSESTIP